jgi:hypothetical protein
MSKPDATRALAIYRTFARQTEAVVQYLSLARAHEHSTRLEIPKIKHAPTSLAASLEEYLNDKDFEINRRQYIAEKEAKKNGGKPTNGASNGASKASEQRAPSSSQPTSQPTAQSQTAPPTQNTSAPLIDLFASLEDNQQTMATQAPMQQQYPQQTGFDQAFQQSGFQQPAFQMPQQTANDMGFAQQQQPFMPQATQGTNPFQMQQQQQTQQQQQIQPQFTGAGFGGYTPQPFSPQNGLASIPQNGVPDFSQQQQMQLPTITEPMQQQPTSTNPFRQSMLPSMPGVAEPKLLSNPTGANSLNRSSTNPFAKQTTGFQQQSPSPMGSSPFSAPSFQSSPFPPQQQQQAQPLQPTPTGTNPFARNASPQNATSPPGGLTVHATGSTNPFRQSAFVNQQTGQGWQTTGGGTIGGMSMDQVPTQNVFPRPGQQQNPNFLG